MYRVWYWLNEELHMVPTRDGYYAWMLVAMYFEPPSYHPWLEFIKRGD